MINKYSLAIIVFVLLVSVIGGAYPSYAKERYPDAIPNKFIKIYGALEKITTGTAKSPSYTNPQHVSVSADMSEGFEGSWPASGWTIIDTSGDDGGEYLFGKRDCHPHTGSFGGWSVGGGAEGNMLNCADSYPNDASTWAVYGPIDLTGATSASLAFYLWGQSEYEASCSYDYLYVGSSIDGNDFSNGIRHCGDMTGGAAGNGYSQVTLDLSSRLGESQVWIGFAFISDVSDTYEGFTIDDLTLTVNNTPGDTPWAVIPSPTINNLDAVDMVSATDGWAVGSGGVILHWDGHNWTMAPSPTSSPLSSVAMVSATDGWIVGGFGTILRWNGSAWTQVKSPNNASLSSVDMVSATDGWAVGGIPLTDEGVILHWNGTAWARVFTAPIKWKGSVSMASATDGWAMGENGQILRWNGYLWAIVTNHPSGSVQTVKMVSATDGWAVGWAIWRWDGAAWTNVGSAPNRLYSVSMVSATEGWAVGYQGVIARWDGAGWSAVTSPVTTTLLSIDMVSDSTGWAVGENGTILRYGQTQTHSIYLPLVLK